VPELRSRLGLRVQLVGDGRPGSAVPGHAEDDLDAGTSSR
jgi:hypothetical protein